MKYRQWISFSEFKFLREAHWCQGHFLNRYLLTILFLMLFVVRCWYKFQTWDRCQQSRSFDLVVISTETVRLYVRRLNICKLGTRKNIRWDWHPFSWWAFKESLIIVPSRSLIFVLFLTPSFIQSPFYE